MKKMQKLRSFLPGQSPSVNASQRHSVTLEPEIGFQINIDAIQQSTLNPNVDDNIGHAYTQQKTLVPELNVHLLSARHLPSLFGFKVVQGYLIKVKLFPGSKRLDSSIQTNTWPKFNENFRFPLAPDIKPALKHSSRRGSSTYNDFTPEELFSGHFVVFTVYALLELPPASFNRFNRTYRSLRDKSSNIVQKIVEGATKDEKENTNSDSHNGGNDVNPKPKRRISGMNPRDSVPPLTISEARRNIGSVTCYLEPKIFKKNPKTGMYATEEIWLPIKDITTTVNKAAATNLNNSPKGVVEIILEVRDVSLENGSNVTDISALAAATASSTAQPTNATLGNPSNDLSSPTASIGSVSVNGSGNGIGIGNGNGNGKNGQWNRMTSEVKRKMGISNVSKSNQHNLVLRITTARMRCSNKVKDELEATAGSVYVKTTIFEHGIYIDSWKSQNFYPSLSTKWDINDSSTITVPLQSLASLDNILIRTTLATKTKMAKKIVLGTVLVGRDVLPNNTGVEQIKAVHEAPLNERIAVWHAYQ